MASTFITHTEMKVELEIAATEETKDDLLDTLCEAIESLWDELTDRKWVSQAHTEYHNAEAYKKKVFLENAPVATDPAVVLYDDPDWEWAAASLIPATDYRVDYKKGIIYYNGFFYTGEQSIKVVYTAGYTASTIPAAIKQIMVRQVAHWYKQGQDRSSGKSSESRGDGASTSYKDLKNNMLPDFVAMAELYSL